MSSLRVTTPPVTCAPALWTSRATIRRGHGCVRVTVSGELDLATADIFSAELDLALRDAISAPVAEIVVDLRAVAFFSAAGIGVLVRAHARSLPHAIVLRVLAEHPAVVVPLRLTGMAEFFGLRNPGLGHLPRQRQSPER